MQSANNGWQIVNRKKSSYQKNKSKQPTTPPKQKFEEPKTLSSSKGKRCDYWIDFVLDAKQQPSKQNNKSRPLKKEVDSDAPKTVYADDSPALNLRSQIKVNNFLASS